MNYNYIHPNIEIEKFIVNFDKTIKNKKFNNICVKGTANNINNKMSGIKLNNGKLHLGKVILKQFPNAIKAIAKCSEYGHLKYKDTDQDWLNFKRIENPYDAYTDAMIRHFLEEDDVDKESDLPHIYHTAWNAMARLEVYLNNINK